MTSENIAVEIVGEIAPDGVNMIAAALRVVILDEEAFPLDAVVVRLVALAASRPEECLRKDRL